MSQGARDHGGGIDAARARYGGERGAWLDLSTGINPRPYPVPQLDPADWAELPDQAAQARLLDAARAFWNVGPDQHVLAAPGASVLIAGLPHLRARASVRIDPPTYNEYAAAFAAHGWQIVDTHAAIRVCVHPNNPTGALWDQDWAQDMAQNGAQDLTIVDESFCDLCPDQSAVPHAGPGLLVLKSFGKFWGLAGLRLGFAIGGEAEIGALRTQIGPWAVSGPALRIGAAALRDTDWAAKTRARLTRDAARLDDICARAGLRAIGGTALFRLYETGNAARVQDRLARSRIWSRVFPYSGTWLRLGLPGTEADWARLCAALDLA